MLNRRAHFVSIWIILTLLLLALLVVALYPAHAQTTPDTEAIQSLVESMSAAIHAQDRDAYRPLIDWSDPVFALEHTRWMDEWATEAPVDRLALHVDQITVDGDTATALMTFKWAMLPDTSFQSADYWVRFTRAEDGGWRYAGEQWVSYDTDYFIVRAAPGLESTAERVIDLLPDIYAHATGSLNHVPEGVTEIKLYDSYEALIANTLLSLPMISGWNEPGESLKLVAGTDSPAYFQTVIAHEFTHKLMFDMAGTTDGRYPWWVAEGIAEWVASEYWTPERVTNQTTTAQKLLALGRWVDWDRISDFDTTPVKLWAYVYPQGYVFVRYVTDTFGQATRNAWLADMAVEMDLDAATQADLDLSFEEVDQGFRAWLAAQ